MVNEPRVLMAELTACEGCEADVRAVLAKYGEFVRTEPGNTIFNCHQSESDSRRFIVYEAYADESAFQAHIGTAENAKINAELAPITEGGSSLTFLLPFE